MVKEKTIFRSKEIDKTITELKILLKAREKLEIEQRMINKNLKATKESIKVWERVLMNNEDKF